MTLPLFYRRFSLPGPRLLSYPLAALAAVTAASILWAADPALAQTQAIRLLFLLGGSLAIMRWRPEPRWVLWGIGGLVLLQTAVALLQFGLQDDLGLRWLGEIELNRYPGGGSILFSGGDYWLRGYGLMPHPNILGGVLVVSILTLIAPFLQARRRAKIMWLAMILFGSAGLFVSFSRSAWLGGVVGGLFLLGGLWAQAAWRRQYGRSLAVLLVSGGLLLAGLGWSQRHLLLARFSPASSEFESRSVAERTVLSAAGWQLLRTAPWTGIGAGNTAAAIAPLVEDIPNVGAQAVHNVPLLLAIELGVPGAVLWLWLLLLPPGLTFYYWRHGRLTLWALALAAALVAFAVIDLFDYYAWGWPQGMALRWILWGLWGAALVDE